MQALSIEKPAAANKKAEAAAALGEGPGCVGELPVVELGDPRSQSPLEKFTSSRTCRRQGCIGMVMVKVRKVRIRL